MTDKRQDLSPEARAKVLDKVWDAIYNDIMTRGLLDLYPDDEDQDQEAA